MENFRLVYRNLSVTTGLCIYRLVSKHTGILIKDSLYQVGYNTSIKGIYLNVAWNYSKSPWTNADKIVSLNVSLPISNWLSSTNDGRSSSNAMTATYGYSQDNHGQVNQYTGYLVLCWSSIISVITYNMVLLIRIIAVVVLLVLIIVGHMVP